MFLYIRLLYTEEKPLCEYLTEKENREQKARKYLLRNIEILSKQDSQHRALKEWHL